MKKTNSGNERNEVKTSKRQRIPRVFLLLICIFAAFLFVYSQIKNDNFAPAKDFPRGALVYVQVADLPAFIKLWNESKLKEKYLASDNFTDFQNNHLGRKLASRRQEFNTAAGFQFDLETLSGLANDQAAIALYDVGKLEFVFLAPVSDEVFAATKFLQNKDKFTEETLIDGTIVYRAAVEADRGRQKQELIFTNSKGRLIIATSQKLLAQTLDNVAGKSNKNRLADEPSFQLLSSEISPHTAAVWLDQKLLNEDYYFKRYWLMSDAEDLKNIRAGMFDFEIQAEKFVEKRKFLLNESKAVAPLDLRQSEKILALLPENIPFFNLQKAENSLLNEAVQKTIFYRNLNADDEEKRGKTYRSYGYDDYENYESLGSNFDEKIDETDALETVSRAEKSFDFSKTLTAANPQSVLTFGEPKILPAPLFIEFDRAAVFYLAAPNSFDRQFFEAEISRSLLDKTMISASGVKLIWKTENENNLTRRTLGLPLIDWEISYILQGNTLVLTNNAEFLHKIFAPKNTSFKFDSGDSFARFSAIDLTQKDAAFTKIFAEIENRRIDDYFFSQNIESLINALSDVKKIEIKQQNYRNILDEEIVFHLNTNR